MLQVSEIYIYPIKSFPGIKLKRATVTEKGFEHDRRWMLVDKNNRFISQRELPMLTQFTVVIEDDKLITTSKIYKETFTIDIKTPPTGGNAEVIIWDDTCNAQFVSDEADEWFSKMLETACRLVYMPDNTRREVDPNYAPADAVTSFADAYPFLIIGQSSLDELNNRLTEPLPIDRFRPNIVFTGGQPFQEDLIGQFEIAGVNFNGVKLCARCIITTINQVDGIRAKEPLKTLASYRLKNNKILFGQNLVHSGEGVVTIGDELHVISYNNDDRFIVPAKTAKDTLADIS